MTLFISSIVLVVINVIIYTGGFTRSKINPKQSPDF